MEKTIELSDESRDAVEAFNRLLEAGEVFGDDKLMRRTCDVYLGADRCAQALGKDLARQSGEEYEESGPPASWELVYNAKINFMIRLNDYCGSGTYDWGLGRCTYNGIVSC